MKKNKYLQIFNYLLEFSKIRSKPVRDIETQETQYPEKLWLNEIPANDLFENVIRDNFIHDNDYWIKVRKPKEPEKPAFAELPNKLQLWVELSSLLNEEEGPTLKETIEVEGTTLSKTDFPEVDKELERYINERWLDDLIDYKDKIAEYEREYKLYETLNNTYKQLFRIYNKAQQFGEEYELVVGVGLLNFKENPDKPKIFRHVITQRCDINFEYSQKESQIYVSPNIESSPQMETDSIIDLFEQFDSQNIIDAERAVENYIKEKEIGHLFFDGLILDTLQLFADRFSPDGKFVNNIEKPNTIETKPTIHYSPALLLRKRNTKSFTALYEKIIENIENEGDEVEIPSIDDLIYIQENPVDRHSNTDLSNSLNSDDTIYFPKEYNDEQIEIIKRASRNKKVLVQGPPGTGKSHTIANLICHLLAKGKKVLITAYTKRALEVLKEKLPEEFQNLAVNLLSGDSASMQDLQSSVNAINDELSRANLTDYQNEIVRLNNDLSEVREKIAFNTNELIKIKEKATRQQEINSVYIGTLTEIAEKLEADSVKFEWYKDSFCDIENKDAINDLQRFIELNTKYSQIDVSEFDYYVPDKKYLPLVEQIRQYQESVNRLTYHASKEEHILIRCSDYSKLESMLSELAGLYNQAERLQIDFAESLITSYLQGNAYQWRQKLDSSSQILKRIQVIDLKRIDRDIEITYNLNNSLKQLKNDAQVLLKYLNEGNSLSGLSFNVKKPFLSKELKEKLYFIESVRVNGSPCDTVEEFEAVIRDIELQQDFGEISQLWNSEIPKGNSYSNKLSFFNNIHSEVKRLIELIDKSEQLRSNIEAFSNIKIKPFDKSALNVLIQETEYNYLLKIVNGFKELINKAEDYLNQNNIHPISEKILRIFKQIDHQSYEQILNNLESISNKKAEYQDFKTLQIRLQNIFPNLIENILSEKFTRDNLSEFQQAIYFRHAQNEIRKFMDVNYEERLFNDLKEYERKKKKFISKIASKKAWCEVLQKLQQNRAIRQHLEAWVQAVKKIGKTGRGKRALKFRKVAQQQMDKCKSSVPCWIMPLYKVAETIQPEQKMYDYVIIDEASQLGPDAIFLLYISKNIIIVGDDKQTSPEYVGVDANTMTPYINRHLKDIPFKDYYGPEFSFFDHARRFCDSVTVLREHFRCMPEIIEFSNKHFYAPEGKGLYPLKQYSEKRLEPLQTVFCQNGYTEGTGARIINKPEANKIVETIANLIEDGRYFYLDDKGIKKPKTFGIITLQGNQQAAIIENLLLKKIGESEFHKRKIVCGNSASFQGDERDIIFLSLVTAHNHNRSAFVKPEDERRFNVAVSRAKEQIWLFHSVELEDLSNNNDLRYKLLDHLKNYNTPYFINKHLIPVPKIKTKGTQPSPYGSWFEVEVRNDIIAKGYSIIPQYEVAKGKYRIDLVALLPDGTKIAIECDGDKYHGDDQYRNDIMRQKVLERCGWQFFRVRGYEYYTNRGKALEPLWKLFQEMTKNEGPIQSLVENLKTKEFEMNTSNIVKKTNESYYRSPNIEPDLFNRVEHNIKTERREAPKETKQTINLSNKNRSKDCTEMLIFTNQHNVYKLKNSRFDRIEDITEKVEYEEGEKPVYITGTYNYSGFLITAYENGKVAKVFMTSYRTQTNRKRLKNAYSDASKLIFIEHIETDIDLIAISTIDKVLLFNTADINPKESPKSLGVQVMKPKANSRLKVIKKPNQVKFKDFEYYRKHIPATGNYILKYDEY